MQSYIHVNINFVVTYKEIPKCEFCNKEMRSWAILANEHYHDECFAESVAKDLCNILLKYIYIKKDV